MKALLCKLFGHRAPYRLRMIGHHKPLEVTCERCGKRFVQPAALRGEGEV